MKITEYCDALNINMRVEYIANACCGWRARIDGSHIDQVRQILPDFNFKVEDNGR